MEREGGGKDLLLQQSLDADLSSLPLAVSRQRQDLVDHALPILVHEEAIVVVGAQKPGNTAMRVISAQNPSEIAMSAHV